MNKVKLAIALHFHQPVGNFGNIFERAHQLCYQPLIELLASYPELKFSFHISGCLIDYLDNNHPKTIALIRRMVEQKQIEIMGGAYYEPILISIPENDITGQISMMTNYIKRRFQATPSGMWIAERVWDPSLAKIITKTGIRYLILDDEHLLRAGVNQEEIYGYFLTGNGGEKIAVFPSSKKLRYLIPFKAPHETIDYLKTFAQKEQPILFTYGDDAEKFGEWPGTHEWVFTKHWLRNFLNELQSNSDWIELTHFSDYLNNNQPIKTLEIPQGSYEEMMEWSDGNWLNFLSKYPESNQMHKRMLYVSDKIKQIAATTNQSEAKLAEQAKKELYLGQCNCAYWHGVFGGLYLYHLRRAIYGHLIKADSIIDSLIHKNKKGWVEIKEVNFNQDNKNKIIIENENFSIFIDPAEAGVIKELDYKPPCLNLTNTLSRKKEPYHEKILQAQHQENDNKVATIHDDFRKIDPSLKDNLSYDKHSRSSFRSYLVDMDTRLEGFIGSNFKELADFSSENYSAEIKNKIVTLYREAEASGTNLTIKKTVGIKSKTEIEFSCSVSSNFKEFSALLALEFNFTLPDLNSNRYFYSADGKDINNLNEPGQTVVKSTFGISDSSKELGINFRFSNRPDRIFYFPVKTISQSERAYELNYQCSCILLLWELDLKEGNKAFTTKFTFTP